MNCEKLKELESVRKRNGGLLTAEKVIEAARPEESPLHEDFTWDDEVAGHKCRLQEAEGLIRSFKIVEREITREVRSYGVCYYTPSPLAPKGYAVTEDLLRGPERRDTLLQEMNRCAGHVARLAGYLEMAGLGATAAKVVKAMSDARSAVERLREAEAGT